MKKIFLSALLLLAIQYSIIAQAPYTVTVNLANKGPLPGLQSFVHAISNGKLLVFGGRKNGFHRTSDKESTFPSQFSNDSVYVIDLATWKVTGAPMIAAFLPALSATNMQYYQDGNILYCIGGYGSTCPQDSATCYQTFPVLTVLNVPNIIARITSKQAIMTSDIISITDERMRVTGGTLEKIGDYFYLVFGHNFHTIYKGGLTGIYTEQVRKFKISYTGKAVNISDYQAINTPLTYEGLSQFHRRDLNIVPSIMTDGSLGLTALGGVFTKQAGPFPNPISIMQSTTGNTSVTIDTTFQQKCCVYECAKVLMFDPASKNMYTSLLGGITNYYYQGDSLVPSNLDNFTPFFNHVSTIARNASGGFQEYPQYAPALPGFIGSNAIFIPAPTVSFYEKSDDIIDYSKLPSGNTMVGWVYGGILATAQQANELNPTYANNNLYEVWIQKNTSFKNNEGIAGGSKKMLAQMPGANIVDSSFSDKLNYARQHPEEWYAHKNSLIWQIISFIVLAGLLFLCFYYFRTSALCRDLSYDPRDPNRLRPVDQRPYSFSRVQLFWWTVIIFFCNGWFLALYGCLFPINPTIAILLGGGLAVTIFGKTIDNSQTKKDRAENAPASRHQDLEPTQGFLADILSDEGGIGIHRLQAVIFNVLFGLAFLQGYFYNISDGVHKYPFVDFDEWQFILLGISSSGYLGVKANENNDDSRPDRIKKKQKIQSQQPQHPQAPIQ